MEEEIKNLKLEIQVLQKRVSELEKIEKRRKVFQMIKGIFTVFLVIAILLAGYFLYQKIMDMLKPIMDLNNSFDLNNLFHIEL